MSIFLSAVVPAGTITIDLLKDLRSTGVFTT